MTDRYTTEQNETPAPTEPFNSAVDHYQKIMGMPSGKADLKTFPKFIKYFYYFVITFVIVAFLLMILIPILN